MPKLQSLVDGDTAVYRTCFGKGVKTFVVDGKKLAYKTTFLEVVDGIDNFMYWIQDLFETRPRIFLTNTNDDNFRYKVATIKPYKGNRDPNSRPPYHKELREYLINEWNAAVSIGCEADDMMASAQTSNTVLVTIDKDMTQCPGYYFNPVKNELRLISQEEADFNFYYSMLVGDVSDSIPGITGIGKAKAPRLLEGKNKQEMEDVVKGLYNKQYGDKGEAAFKEIYQLLWLRRDIKL